MKKNINVFEHAANILESLGKGILFTTMAEGKINTMAIGWGLLGIEWGVPVFTAFIREGRYTRKMLEKNPQ